MKVTTVVLNCLYRKRKSFYVLKKHITTRKSDKKNWPSEQTENFFFFFNKI